MNYRIPHTDVLAGTKVLFLVATREDTELILIDAYSLKKQVIPMEKKVLIYSKLLPFNEAGRYLYYFKVGDRYLDTEGMKDEEIIHPFTLTVYKENSISVNILEEQLNYGII